MNINIDISTAGAIELTRKGEAYAEAHVGRREVEAEIDRLIALLDEWDSDPDLEPTLGSPTSDPGWMDAGSQTFWAAGSTQDGEAEDVNEDGGDILDEPHDGALDQCEGEDWEDLEYSLGWPQQDGQHPAVFAAANASGDREGTDEDGGDVLDEPHDSNTSEDCEYDEPTIFNPQGSHLHGGGSLI